MDKNRKKYCWKRIGVGLVLLVLMAGPIGVFFHFNGIRLSPEAMDNAQLARNIARGRGFVTGVIRPASRFFNENISGQPDLYQPPLPSLLLAAGFRVFGPSDRVVVLWALLLFWLAGLLGVSLLRRVWGIGGALLGAALYFTNASLLNAVRSGDPSLPASLIFITLLVFIYRSENTLGSFLAAGLLCGAGYLSSYSLFWFGLLPLIWLVFSYRSEAGEGSVRKNLSALAAGFILPLLWWWWRSGYLLPPLRAAEYKMFTGLFPADSLLRETGRELFGRSAGLKTLIRKWWQGGETVYGRLLFFTGSFAVVFFYLALLLPFADRKWSRIRYFIFGALLLGAGQFVFFARRGDDIRFLVPAAIPLATAAFIFILEKMKPARGIARCLLIVVFVGLNLIPAVDQLRISRPPADSTRYNCLRMGDWIPAGEGIVTDQPEAVAWYGDRLALWLPAEAVAPMGFRYLYLTAAAADYPPVRTGKRVVVWPRVYQAGARSTLWEVEEFIPLPGDQFLCRIAGARD
ncbi:MAG: glycosyltransferase family 39 protein [Candidatus Erginobacter occultus]|nr:glycosyltransferase family 39 protein [Candidatus Erginobacter occultus]